jgi:3',5'-cyclic AMP phosphodiesterase CpdA
MTSSYVVPDGAAQAPADVVTLAVASDLHAFESAAGSDRPSTICCNEPDDEPFRHPVAGLKHLIATNNLTADVVLCPGDLAHKASLPGLKYGWRVVDELRSALGATVLAGTCGNHDVDSRFQTSDYDAQGHMLALRPTFPFADDDGALTNEFWARRGSLLVTPRYRIASINSSAYHGGAANEITHGRIAEDTIAYIRARIAAGPALHANVLLCHHHPQQQMELGLGEHDVMRGGQLLLELLGTGEFGKWLVVHGHKHMPKLTYAAGGAGSPVVLSAGSLGVELYRELQTRARNLFHIVEIPAVAPVGLGLCGVVRSWEWRSGYGWTRATASAGIPHECGFGYRGDVAALASAIATQAAANPMSWQDVIAATPEARYLTPQDQTTLQRSLSDLGFLIQMHDDVWYQVGRTL